MARQVAEHNKKVDKSLSTPAKKVSTPRAKNYSSSKKINQSIVTEDLTARRASD